MVTNIEDTQSSYFAKENNTKTQKQSKRLILFCKRMKQHRWYIVMSNNYFSSLLFTTFSLSILWSRKQLHSSTISFKAGKSTVQCNFLSKATGEYFAVLRRRTPKCYHQRVSGQKSEESWKSKKVCLRDIYHTVPLVCTNQQE